MNLAIFCDLPMIHGDFLEHVKYTLFSVFHGKFTMFHGKVAFFGVQRLQRYEYKCLDLPHKQYPSKTKTAYPPTVDPVKNLSQLWGATLHDHSNKLRLYQRVWNQGKPWRSIKAHVFGHSTSLIPAVLARNESASSASNFIKISDLPNITTQGLESSLECLDPGQKTPPL